MPNTPNSVLVLDQFGNIPATILAGNFDLSVLMAAADPTNGPNGLLALNSAGAIPNIPIVGPASGASAAVGDIGEFQSSGSIAGVPMTTNVAANITSLILTAGNWELWASLNFVPGGATGVAVASAFVSATSLSITPISPDVALKVPTAATVGLSFNAPVGRTRVSIAANTTFFLVAQIAFSGGTLTAGGIISAVRTY